MFEAMAERPTRSRAEYRAVLTGVDLSALDLTGGRQERAGDTLIVRRETAAALAAAERIVAAVKETGLKLPLVVRLEGNNVEAGKKTLAESGLTIIGGGSMADAAQKVVKAVGA